MRLFSCRATASRHGGRHGDEYAVSAGTTLEEFLAAPPTHYGHLAKIRRSIENILSLIGAVEQAAAYGAGRLLKERHDGVIAAETHRPPAAAHLVH